MPKSQLSVNQLSVHQINDNGHIYNICLAEEVENFIILHQNDSKQILNALEIAVATLENERKDFQKAIEFMMREVEVDKKKLETLTTKQTTEHERKLSEYQEAINQNKQYQEWYGTLISPILIITELWNNGQKGELDMLVPPSQWSVGKGLGGENGKRAKRYWLSQFQEWGLIKQWGRGRYMSNVGMYEALEILNKMMKKQNLIIEEKGENDE